MERVFDIVDQLNRGASLLAAEDEKIRLAELNLLAARRARASAALPSAVVYASAGVGAPARGQLAERIPRCRSRSSRACVVRVPGGAFRGGRDRVGGAVCAGGDPDRFGAAVAVVEMNLHTNQVRSDQAVETAIECLRDFGIALVAHPTRDLIQRAYEETRRTLGSRRIDDLIDLPRMTDPAMRAALDVLKSLSAPALQTDVNLLCLVACCAVNLSIRYGNTDASSVAYVYFGMILARSSINTERRTNSDDSATTWWKPEAWFRIGHWSSPASRATSSRGALQYARRFLAPGAASTGRWRRAT